jgi:threonine synthase
VEERVSRPDLRCSACGREETSGPIYPPTCACGGLWQAINPAIYLQGIPDDLAHRTPIWRDPRDAALFWKREDYLRTGSFKDRGAVVLVAWARRCGATRLVADSSGSAALAAASAAARHGLSLRVHVPGTLARERIQVLSGFGADVVAVGTREDAGARALSEAATAFYASHVHHPAFTAGTSQAGLESLAQLGADSPSWWVVPVGNGSLLLGLAQALERPGHPEIRLVAVQAAACAGLLRPGIRGATAASGIAIADPARRTEIMSAIERSGGTVLEAGETDLARAREALWHRGAAVETASAAALVAVEQLRSRGEQGPILGFLTGCGHRGG